MLRAHRVCVAMHVPVAQILTTDRRFLLQNCGNPITKHARKTNHIERFNNTMRQRVSRLVRDTLAFSKKLANHIGTIKYFICYYNLTRAAALLV
jgi:IS1 family transposase